MNKKLVIQQPPVAGGETGNSFSFKRLEGIFLKLGSLACFALMQIIAKALYIAVPTITPLEVLYFRGISVVIMNYMYSRYIRLDLLSVPKEQFMPMFYRSVTGAIGSMLVFTSTKLFPLSLVSALSYLSPMLTALLSYLFLHESLTKFDVGTMIVAFFGVVLIVFNPYKRTAFSQHFDIKWYYYFSPLLNPFFGAVSTLLMRYMGKRIHFILAPTFLGVVVGAFTPLFALPIIAYEARIPDYSLQVVVHLLLIGVSGWLGQILLSRSLQIEKAGRVQAFNYINVVFMMTADIALFGIPIQWLDFLGIAVIIGSNGLVTVLRGCRYIE